MSKINILIAALYILTVATAAQQNGHKDKSLRKHEGIPSYKKFNVNNISTFFKNDGESDINYLTGNSGFEFPKGSGKAAVFQSGFLWGGVVNEQKRVGGSVYRQGTVAGKILNSGVPPIQLIAEDPQASNVRNYRVRPDYKTGSMASEIADDEGSETEIRAAYEKDWNEWPATDGAPYNDVDSNGVYDPAVDIPGIPGADQTIWFVCNDLDANQTVQMYGSPPMGIEEQVTIWGYSLTGPLGNILFRKYKIINKSNALFDSMFVSMWNDPDIGDAVDDYVGCDTILSLTFAYNGDDSDAVYGNSPPAVGFCLLKGPVVDSKKLSMTSHYFFLNSGGVYIDPPQGFDEGVFQWFNLFNGAISTTGETFIDPVSGLTTKFALAGDPITGEGWVDGIIAGPGDRRAGFASGPFTMTPGDTQVIVVAEIAAGASPGVTRLMAIDSLKYYAAFAKQFYENNIATSISDKDEKNLPLNFYLFQNYPNPFNPSTRIKYNIPAVETKHASSLQIVTLKVYDVLGRETEELINEIQPPGNYEVEFDGSNLSSGIYFYRLSVGDFSKVKKMILLR